MPINRKRKQKSEKEAKKRDLHELPYTVTEIVKSGTIRITSGSSRVSAPVDDFFKPEKC